MAQVAQDPQLQERIEGFLTYALREWSSIPAYAAEFETWDPVDQLVFVHEWAIRESALVELRNYAEQRLLTPAQHQRYQRLQRLVARHRATLDRLLAD